MSPSMVLDYNGSQWEQNKLHHALATQTIGLLVCGMK